MIGAIEFRFTAALQSLEPGEGRLATFYLMDTSLNRNNWRVTGEALAEALPTLVGKPLGCIPGYRVNHVHRPQVVGRWLGGEKLDGHALATAEITDDVAWGKVEAGEWGAVSVVIRAGRVSCSVCGEDVTGAPDEHIRKGVGHEVVEGFVFDRVDFVSEPAYPRAGLRGIISWSAMDGAQGPQGLDPKPDEKEGKRLDDKIEELRKEFEAVKAENETLKQENAGLRENADENQNLRERVEALEAERHGGFVDAALEARRKAGLVEDVVVETERLRGLEDETLALLAGDAARIVEKEAKAVSQGPRARYVAGDEDTMNAAVEDTRMRLFGHRREAEG